MKNSELFGVIAGFLTFIIVLIVLSLQLPSNNRGCPKSGDVIIDPFTKDSVIVERTYYMGRLRARTPNHQIIQLNCEDLK